MQRPQQRSRTHPRTAPPCTLLHHSCQKAAQRIRTLTTSVEQATLAGHSICHGPRLPQTPRQKERKIEWQSQAMQGAAVNNAAVVISYHAVLLTAAISRCCRVTALLMRCEMARERLVFRRKGQAVQCAYPGIRFWTEGESHACRRYRVDDME